MTERSVEKLERQRAALKNKALELVAWFDGRPMPTEPVKITGWITINNVAKHNDWLIGILKNGDNPYNPIFISAYKILEQLKIFIENESTGATDCKP